MHAKPAVGESSKNRAREYARWASHELMHDRAAPSRRQFWSPVWVLVSSSCIALLIIFLYRYARRVGLDAEWLFAKEGPLEQFTFAAELVAAVLLGIAARRVWIRAHPSRTLVTSAYAACAILLFVVGMEEISWGQQLFHFSTPQEWATLNYQQETTLHNLIERDALDATSRYVTYAFAAGAILLSALGVASNRPFLTAIAPHPSLAPLACATAYAGWALHFEVVEGFVALYFLFYSYRVFRNAEAVGNAP